MLYREITKRNWMEGIRKAMNERNLNEGQWEYRRKQWSLGVGQRRKAFWNRYMYMEIIAACSQIHTKHINGQNVELLNVKLTVYKDPVRTAQ
jgi:hypothetical protein